MRSKQQWWTIGSLVLISSLLALLTGCATTHRLPQPQITRINPNTALIQAEDNPDQTAAYLLQAAQAYIQQKQITHAQQILAQVHQTTLTAAQKTQQTILQAQLLLAQQHYLACIHQLNQNMSTPNQSQQLQINTTLFDAYKAIGNTDKAIDFGMQSYRNADKSINATSLMTFWRYLQTVPLSQLQTLAANAALSNETQGWVQLALIPKTNADTAAFQQALRQWHHHFANHPANQLLNTNLLATNRQTPNKITLMVPLTGPLAANGIAIRNAFLARYYQMKQQDGQLPNIAIAVVDTNKTPVTQLYQQAIAQGSQEVVGPLTKDNVTAISQLKTLPIPVLALNTIALPTPKPHLTLFGLSPVDSAVQSAQHAWQFNQAPNAMVIAPGSSWGSNLANQFSQQWQQQGGQILQTITYQSRQDLYTKIRDLLQYNQSQFRMNTIENTIGKKVRTTPRIRHDINMIFVVAMPNMARQIMPLLKFYYAGRIPVYATSTIYSGVNQTNTDKDLNGLYFSDMPFVFNKKFAANTGYNQLKQMLAQLYPNQFQQNQKLYALGVDAFTLSSQLLPKLQLMPSYQFQGTTGLLSLSPQQVILRGLNWARMVQGTPALL